MAFSPDGKRIVTSTTGGLLQLWDAHTGDWLVEQQDQIQHTYDLVYTPDGKRLVTASEDGLVHVRDASSGETLLVLREPRGAVLSLAFSPDGARLATGMRDGTVRIYETTPSKERRALRRAASGVRDRARALVDELFADNFRLEDVLTKLHQRTDLPQSLREAALRQAYLRGDDPLPLFERSLTECIDSEQPDEVYERALARATAAGSMRENLAGMPQWEVTRLSRLALGAATSASRSSGAPLLERKVERPTGATLSPAALRRARRPCACSSCAWPSARRPDAHGRRARLAPGAVRPERRGTSRSRTICSTCWRIGTWCAPPRRPVPEPLALGPRTNARIRRRTAEAGGRGDRETEDSVLRILGPGPDGSGPPHFPSCFPRVSIPPISAVRSGLWLSPAACRRPRPAPAGWRSSAVAPLRSASVRATRRRACTARAERPKLAVARSSRARMRFSSGATRSSASASSSPFVRGPWRALARSRAARTRTRSSLPRSSFPGRSPSARTSGAASSRRSSMRSSSGPEMRRR